MKLSLLLPTLASLLPLGLTGCVSRTYQLAGRQQTPATALNWHSETSPVELSLRSVVIYRGPGSWKSEARWDEYQVTVRNTGSETRTVTNAELTNFEGTAMNPGVEPWSLEKESLRNTRRLADALGNAFQFGTGTILPAMAGMAVSPGATRFVLTGGSVGPALIAAGPVVLPVALGASVYRDMSNKHAIEAEFSRRRLALPLTLAAGETVTGSLFFPVTPGPQLLRIRLSGQTGQDSVVLALQGLASLHLGAPAGEPGSVELKPVERNGRFYLAISVDTNVAGAEVHQNGRIVGHTPANIEVETDSRGRLVKSLQVWAYAPGRQAPDRTPGRLAVQAGTIPPAQVHFSRGIARQIPFAAPEGSRTSPLSAER